LECSKLKEMKKTGILTILIILALKSFSQTAPIAPKYIRTDSIGGFTDNTTLYIQPRGTGKIALSGLLFPTADGTAGQVIQTDGSGVLSFTSGSGDMTKAVYDTGDNGIVDNSEALGGTAAASYATDAEVSAGYQPLDTDLTAIGGLTSAANKIPYFTGSGTAGVLDFVDEDAMTSNSATAIPSQQSVKAYVDASGSGDVSKVGTPVNNQVGVWTGDGTLEGTNDFQFTGDTAYINGVSIGEIGGYPFVHNSLVGLGLIVGGGINISTSLGGNVRVYSATAGGGLANGITFYRGATRSGFFSGSTGDLTLDAGLFVATTTGTATALLGTSSANQAVDVTLGSNLSIVSGKLVQTIPYSVALSAATGDIATGTDVYSIRMPYAATLTGVKLSIGTAPVGSTVIVDINEAGTTILSTKLSIDASETTSATAATAAVISDAALADDAIISFDIDQVGSSTAGARLLITLSLRID
jgi:hypothetical protein